MRHQIVRGCQLGAALLVSAWPLCGGCASVSVHKVPGRDAYEHWSDELQRKADEMEGVRFYLPRPWVNVFESFPVATDIYLASGTVSPDGRHVIVTSIVPASSPAQLGTPRTNKIPDLSIPTKWISAAPAAGDAAPGKASSRSADDVPEKPPGNPPEPEQPVQPAQPTTPKSGQSQRSVVNDNGAFAYQPMRGNMDVVYLPDFDEQYVVSSKTGLGNAQFQVNLGQGWSLQGFNSLADNSELNQRIFGLIDKASDLATQLASSGTSRLLESMKGATGGLASARSGSESREIASAGSQVTLKIVVVHYAAKGLYPVIKPRELKGAVSKHTLLNLQEAQPQGAQAWTSAQVEYAVDRFDALQRRFTLPVYPYQYISFNTFRYMAIEVLSPDGAPFGSLYDKTGTQGDAGDRQVADLAQELRALLSRNGGSDNAGRQRATEVATKALQDLGKTLPKALAPLIPDGLRKDPKSDIKSVILTPAGVPLKQIDALVELDPKPTDKGMLDQWKAWLEGAIKQQITDDSAISTAMVEWTTLPVNVRFK